MADESSGVIRYIVAKRWFRISLAVLLGLFVVSYFFYRWSLTPVSTTDLRPELTSTPTDQPAYQIYATDYFSTEIPYGWRITDDAATGSRLQQVAISPGTSTGQIAFTSDVLPSDGLSGVGDYNLRTHNVEAYHRIKDLSLPEDSIVYFSDSDSSYTAFLTNNGRYASVSVSNTTTSADSLTILTRVIDNWTWQ